MKSGRRSARSSRSSFSRASRRSSATAKSAVSRPLSLMEYKKWVVTQAVEPPAVKRYGLWTDVISRERFTASRDERSGTLKTVMSKIPIDAFGSPPPTVKRRRRGHTRSKFKYPQTPDFSDVPLHDTFEEQKQKVLQGDAIYCMYRDQNKFPVRATRQCLDCALLDQNKGGYYCEEEFHRAHPWYRKTHEWVYVVQRPGTPPPSKLTKAEKMKIAAEDLLKEVGETKEEFRRGATESVSNSLAMSTSKASWLPLYKN